VQSSPVVGAATESLASNGNTEATIEAVKSVANGGRCVGCSGRALGRVGAFTTSLTASACVTRLAVAGDLLSAAQAFPVIQTELGANVIVTFFASEAGST
jgi:hypothetical protein